MSGGAGYVYSHSALQKITQLLSSKSSVPTENRTQRRSCNTESIFGIEDLEIGNVHPSLLNNYIIIMTTDTQTQFS